MKNYLYIAFLLLGLGQDLHAKTPPTNHTPAQGTVEQVWYPVQSSTTGRQRRMSIYLPPSYSTDEQYYPVLYLLHGSMGDELDWLTLGNAEQILNQQIAQGKCKQMIVVMPNGNIDQDASPSVTGIPANPDYNPIRLNGQFEEQFADVIAYVEKHYRTITKKHSRAIAGLSMGGFHAMHISHYYNQLFDYVGLFSPTYNTANITREERQKTDLTFPADMKMPRVYRNVEKDLARQFAKPPRLYWIAIGKDDFLYKENVQYRAILDAKGYPYEYYESAGGHSWKNWQDYLTIFLERLFAE